MADLDSRRVGRAVMQEVAEIRIRSCGTDQSIGAALARRTKVGLGRSWRARRRASLGPRAFCMRLDEPDPVAAWQDHVDQLKQRADTLTDLRPDALRYRGPGTDLTVGLLPTSRWVGGASETATGIRFVANMPTEEASTAPDRRRAEGTAPVQRCRSRCRARSCAASN